MIIRQIDGQCSIHMGGLLGYQEVSSKNRNWANYWELEPNGNSVSCPPTIHPLQYAGGCWFTVAGKFGMGTCQVWQNSILDTGVQLFIPVHHPFQAHSDWVVDEPQLSHLVMDLVIPCTSTSLYLTNCLSKWVSIVSKYVENIIGY